MPKCAMFKHGMTVNPRGRVRPCCNFADGGSDLDFDKKEHWESKFAEYDRLMSASQDTWIPECEDCRLEEKDTGNSLRLLANERYLNTKKKGRQYWDLKINNTCNLTCRMCSPGDSSTWLQLIKNNLDTIDESEWAPHLQGHMGKKSSWHDTMLPLVKQEILGADIVKFTGGEPMLVRHVKEVIQHLIDTGHSNKTELLITTNCTVPFVGWWESIIEKFREVKITLSIDGVDEAFEYQRAGASWKEVNNNTAILKKLQQKHKNLEVSINYTNTALNIKCKDATKQWVNKMGFGWNNGGMEISNPKYLSYASVDYPIRKRYNIKSHYEFDPKQLDILKKQMFLLDKTLGTDFKQLYPEYFE